MSFDGWEFVEIMAFLFSDEKGKQEVIELVKNRMNNENN